MKFKALERKGKEVAGPDDGAHTVDDYLAGRLVADSQEALDRIIAMVEKRFEVIGHRDRMADPIQSTGYTGLYYQVKLPNGMTAEIQVQPRVFWEAAKERRPSYDILRVLEGKKWTDAERAVVNEERRKSRTIFARAWREWIASGGKDVRKDSTPSPTR